MLLNENHHCNTAEDSLHFHFQVFGSSVLAALKKTWDKWFKSDVNVTKGSLCRMEAFWSLNFASCWEVELRKPRPAPLLNRCLQGGVSGFKSSSSSYHPRQGCGGEPIPFPGPKFYFFIEMLIFCLWKLIFTFRFSWFYLGWGSLAGHEPFFPFLLLLVTALTRCWAVPPDCGHLFPKHCQLPSSRSDGCSMMESDSDF